MYKNFLCTSIMGHTLSVILRHTLHVIHGCALKGILNHLLSVILGFIPRIHTKHSFVDTRVEPEYDYKVMQCGRSMIEMLGVLAIIGVLSVGGIAGYSKAMETYKINQTKRQITEIITNIQTLYMQQKDFNGLSNTTAVQMGIVPDDLKTSDGEYYTSITNIFGSPVGISGFGKSFYINFLDVTKEGCIALATADWGNSASGLVAISIGFMSGIDDGLLFYSHKGCTEQGHRDGYGYSACANHLPLSPALAAQYCDTNSDWGYDNSFGIKFSK